MTNYDMIYPGGCPLLMICERARYHMYNRGTLVPIWERYPDTFRVTAEYPAFPPHAHPLHPSSAPLNGRYPPSTSLCHSFP